MKMFITQIFANLTRKNIMSYESQRILDLVTLYCNFNCDKWISLKDRS